MQDRTRMLIVTSFTLLASVLVWFNYSAVLPQIVDAWELSGLRAGVIFSAFQAGYLVTIVPMGMAADRYSARWTMAIGAVGTGAASLAFALVATGFLSGTLLRFVSGLFMAGVYVPGMRFLSDWYPSAVRGRAIGLYVGTFSLASGLSFLLAAGVAAAVDWQTAIAVTSVGAIAVGPLMFLLTRDKPGAARAEGGFDLSVLRNRDYLLAVGVYSGHNWELFGTRNWIQAFLVTTPAVVAAGGTAVAGTLTGLMMAIGGLGNAVGGWFSDRVGRYRTIGLALAASALFSITFGSLGWLPLPFLAALLLIYGVAITMDSAPTSTAITEIVDDEHMGTALSMQSLLGFTVTLVSPVVFGAALDAFGYPVAFPTLAIGSVFAIGAVMVLARRVG